MNTVNELFQNVRFLKFYGWGEHPFPFPPFPRAASFRAPSRRNARGAPPPADNAELTPPRSPPL